MYKVAILGSGSGTTANAILEAVGAGSTHYVVSLVATTTPGAGIIDVGKRHGVPTALYDSQTLQDQFIQRLRSEKIALLVLAGFLKLLPDTVIQALNGMVVNTHPALLPAFGGKGMYGKRVHQAVADAGVRLSGVTLHRVDTEYDKGAIIEQANVPIPEGSTAVFVEDIVRNLERTWLPGALDRFILSQGLC